MPAIQPIDYQRIINLIIFKIIPLDGMVPPTGKASG